jgi:hypothetical protein
MDLLDVEGTSLLAPAWWNASGCLHRRRVRTSGAIRRVLREAGFHKIPRYDCIRDFVMREARDTKFEGFYHYYGDTVP